MIADKGYNFDGSMVYIVFGSHTGSFDDYNGTITGDGYVNTYHAHGTRWGISYRAHGHNFQCRSLDMLVKKIHNKYKTV